MSTRTITICTSGTTAAGNVSRITLVNQAVTGPAAAAGAGTGDMLGSNNLSELTSLPTARTNLGLGSAATQSSAAFDAAGLAAAALAASQPLDADLTAIAALTTTATGRSLLAAADATAIRVIAGAVIGTDVQAYDADLAAIAALTTTATGRSLLAASDATAIRVIAGAVIGTNVQAYDADLDAVAALATTGLVTRTGAGTAAARTITGTANLVTVTNGDGVAGNPTLTVGANVYQSGGTDVAVADGGTGSSTAAGAATNLGLGTGDSPQFTAVNVGHASDTTVTRVSAGVIAVEGATLAKVSDLASYLPLLAAGAAVENIGAVEWNVNVVAATGATETLDTSLYGTHDCTMDQNCTFTFSNPAPSGKESEFKLYLRGAFTPTLPASVKWSSATPPTYTTPSVYVFSTVDAGTTWLGSQVGKAFG